MHNGKHKFEHYDSCIKKMQKYYILKHIFEKKLRYGLYTKKKKGEGRLYKIYKSKKQNNQEYTEYMRDLRLINYIQNIKKI